MQLPLVGPAYTERSPNLSAQTCVNLYPHGAGPGAKAPSALYRTPGLKPFADTGPYGIRGMHVFAGRLFVVSGDRLAEVGTHGGVTTVGTLSTAAGPVAMADNGRVMMLADGTAGYLYHDNDGDGAWTLAPVTDPEFPAGASQLAFLDGYFVFDRAGGDPGQFMVSGLYAQNPAGPPADPADDFSALDYATAEADPDGLVAIATAAGHLWLLGEATTEVWYHSGEVFPFSRVGGGRTNRGCAAAGSVAKVGDGLLWLATDRNGRLQVVSTRGFGVEPVSTPAIEYAIDACPRVDDAVGWSYHQEGHTFYLLTLPSAREGGATVGVTWAYDLTTGLWHRRAGWDAEQGRYTRHRAGAYAWFAGRHLVGDHATGKVYQLDPDTHTDDGAPIRWERAAPVIHDDTRRLFFRGLTLDLEAGTGHAGAPDPRVMLDWSDDGGHTWGRELWRGAGKTGEYGRRVVFRHLGSARHRVFRVAGSDPVPVALLGASLQAEAGEP